MRSGTRRSTIMGACLAGLSVVSAAQVGRIAPGSVRIDGVPDEAAWASTPVHEIRHSLAGEAPTVATRFRLATDGDALLVAAECEQPDMGGLRAAGTSRDAGIWQDDCIEVFLDPTGRGVEYVQYWAFVAVRWDGAAWTLFVNGAVAAVETAPALGYVPPVATVPLNLGGYSLHSNNVFCGWLDEARIWDTALSDEHVAAVMLSDIGDGR
jgi:hypothetical protein